MRLVPRSRGSARASRGSSRAVVFPRLSPNDDFVRRFARDAVGADGADPHVIHARRRGGRERQHIPETQGADVHEPRPAAGFNHVASRDVARQRRLPVQLTVSACGAPTGAADRSTISFEGSPRPMWFMARTRM